jgi:hypothetical protein
MEDIRLRWNPTEQDQRVELSLVRPLPLGVAGRHQEGERAGGEDDDVEKCAHPVVDDHPRETLDPALPKGVHGEQGDADA